MATGRERAEQAQRRQQGFLEQAAQARARAQRASLSSEQASRGGDESGLITGGINRRAREKREGEALTEQSAAFEALGQQRAQSILKASGADFDRMSPEITGGITELLADPETRDQGIARLEQVQSLQRAATPTEGEIRDEAITRGLASQTRRNKVQAPLFGQIAAGQQMIASLNEATGFGDIGGIFGLFKFLDPGSRVTGSEVELSGTASTFAQQAQVLLQRVSGQGGLMTPDQRGQLASLVNGQVGLIRGQMIRNNSMFNEQLGAIMSGRFEAGVERAQQVSESTFFQPDIELGEFVPKDNPTDEQFFQPVDPGTGEKLFPVD